MRGLQESVLLLESVSAPPTHQRYMPPELTAGLPPSRCQKAAWKNHSKSCRAHVPAVPLSAAAAVSPAEPTLKEIRQKVAQAYKEQDWNAVIVWEDRMEELLGAAEEGERAELLGQFAHAHYLSCNFLKAASCEASKVELLVASQSFEEAGSTMVRLAACLETAGDAAGGRAWNAKARELAQEHGLFATECMQIMPGRSKRGSFPPDTDGHPRGGGLVARCAVPASATLNLKSGIAGTHERAPGRCDKNDSPRVCCQTPRACQR